MYTASIYRTGQTNRDYAPNHGVYSGKLRYERIMEPYKKRLPFNPNTYPSYSLR